jgi:tetratricopeptide (TPR) repeat protein
MKKATLASMLAVSAFAVVAAAPGTFTHAGVLFAQASDQVTMQPAEYADYDAAMNKETTPQTQAPALQAYLDKYPKSAVKSAVLEKIMADYYQIAAASNAAADQQKAVDAADKVLADNPNSLQADFIEVSFRSAMAASLTDPAAKQSGLDAAAAAAQKGLAATAPTGMAPDQFQKLQGQLAPTFYSAIGSAALNKKDYPSAISAYKSELAATPVAQTQAVGTALQDTYLLGQAYYFSTPPDLLDCTFYTTRAASYAPDQFKTQFQPLANYCYKKFHGGMDGYDTLVIPVAKANVTPPAGFNATIKPAPTNEDIVNQTIASTPDLSTLALSDKEFILQYGKPDDANKVFDTIKGKTFDFPDLLVIDGSTTDKVLVAISDDAVQNKKADFTFNLTTPLKAVPTAGSKISLKGTYTSFTQSPLMITMDGGSEVKKEAPARKPASRRH